LCPYSRNNRSCPSHKQPHLPFLPHSFFGILQYTPEFHSWKRQRPYAKGLKSKIIKEERHKKNAFASSIVTSSTDPKGKSGSNKEMTTFLAKKLTQNTNLPQGDSRKTSEIKAPRYRQRCR
jgi:hypothetical protein